MKLYLDGTNPAPDGWNRCYTAEQVITLLKTNKIDEISLSYTIGACVDCGGDIPIIFENGEAIPFYIAFGDIIEALNSSSPPDRLELDLKSNSMPTFKPSDEIEEQDPITIPAPPKLPTIEICPHIKTGYDVLLWIEQEVALNNFIPPNSIDIHAATLEQRQKMNGGIQSIYKFHELNIQQLEDGNL